MKLRPACLVRLYLLGGFSTLLLAMGQRAGWYAVLMVLAVAAAYVVTEYRRRFLPQRVANWLALLGGVLMVAETRWTGLFTLAIAHLAVYMQLVLLFQEKQPRSLWYLALLALLQVPVAAVMSLQMWFGLLLVAYMFMAVMAMTVFYFYRENLAHESPSSADRCHAAARPAAAGAGENHRLWPLAGAVSSFSSAVAWGASERLPLGRLRWQTVTLGAATLPLAIGVFLISPRAPNPGWGQPVGLAQNITGFDEQVRLGFLGPILESNEPVMKVTFRDADTNDILQVEGTPLFRGAALFEYEDGNWRRPPFQPKQHLPLWSPRGMVRQEIELEPLKSPVVFAARPIFTALEWDEKVPLMVDPLTWTLLRPEERLSRSFRYKVYSPRAEGVQDRAADLGPLPDALRELALAVPRENLPGLCRRARELVAGIPADQQELRARTLEAYFLSGEFGYMLAGGVVDLRLDPIEDFLLNRKAGHCEYFASALALMLREAGVPSRVVNGFRGGEWNEVGRFYQVRQKHAHTWVEAYLGAEGSGFWLTLDPTPSQPRGLPARSLWARLREYRTYVQALWARHVLGFDGDQQRALLHHPFGRVVVWWRQWGDVLVGGRGIRAGRIPWELALMLFGLLLVGLGLTTLFLGRAPGGRPVRKQRRWMWSQWLRWPAWLQWFPRARRLGSARVEFYARLVRLLARHGWVRVKHQTPLEFARQVVAQLAAAGAAREAAHCPELVVETYYRVRYGARELSHHERRAIRDALSRLATALSANHRNGKAATRRVATQAADTLAPALDP